MKKYLYAALIALSALLFPIAALAQAVPDGGGILEQIVDQFQAASSGWASTMQGFALGLFGLLATISFMYNTIMYALRGEAQLYGWMGHVVKEILRIGFWFAVLYRRPPGFPRLLIACVRRERLRVVPARSVQPMRYRLASTSRKKCWSEARVLAVSRK